MSTQNKTYSDDCDKYYCNLAGKSTSDNVLLTPPPLPNGIGNSPIVSERAATAEFFADTARMIEDAIKQNAQDLATLKAMEKITRGGA